MIHIVTTLAGQSEYAKIAQRHAVKTAQMFGARLRIVMIWEPEDNLTGISWEANADKEVERIKLDAGNPNITIERGLRGEGFLKGLIAESRETDLLIVGLPECDADDDFACKVIRKHKPSLLSNVECMFLVVHRDPEPIWNVLVDYHGGVEGKAALRMAGEIAIRASSAVTILCIDQVREDAEMFVSSGMRYLTRFGIPTITTMTLLKESDYESEITHAVESTKADFIVLGEQEGFLNKLLGKTVQHPEVLSLILHRPVLVAR
ncbi:MAG: hypothetical protein ACYC0V_04140 [Armatimonadota bacterium]